MVSFDKSYYDILNRYQGILKEGMGVQPIVYKKTGNTYVPANELDMKIVPPQMLFTKSDDPAAPFVPYDAANATNTAPAAGNLTGVGNPPDVTKPSISVTGDGNTAVQGSGPQASTNVAGMRIQYPTTQQPNVSPNSANKSSSASTPTSKSNATAVPSTPASRPTSASSGSLPTSQTNNKKPTSAQQSNMRRA